MDHVTLAHPLSTPALASASSGGGAASIACEPTEQASKRRRCGGSQQPIVVAGEAPIILRQADLHQRRGAKVDVAHCLAAGQCEAVVCRLAVSGIHAARDAYPFPG